MLALSAPRPAVSCRAALRCSPLASRRCAALRCPRRARAAPARALGEDFESENPQNVAAPERTPSPALQPDAAVRIQLEAAARNDEPRVDHGVHTLYEFAADAGDMDRSRYFGNVRSSALALALRSYCRPLCCTLTPRVSQSKDLYHLDHFLGIKATYPLLFRNDGFEVGTPAAPGPDGLVDVRARVRGGGGETEFVFRMMMRQTGSKAGCWLTKQLLPADSKWLQP
jgi:hypothetical protein